MKVKAVIMRKDRTNQVLIIPVRKIESNTFKTPSGEVYFIHQDRFQVTWDRKLGFKRYYSTYYYREGDPNPLPVPHFDNIAETGVGSSQELSSIFNPWFFRVISQNGMDKWGQVQFYIIVGMGLGIVGLFYFVVTMQGEIGELQGMIERLTEQNRPPTEGNTGTAPRPMERSE